VEYLKTMDKQWLKTSSPFTLQRRNTSVDHNLKRMSAVQTRLQRLKDIQSFLSFIAVNLVYGVKKTCQTAIKEKHAFERYEALIVGFFERKGRWCTFDDVAAGEFTVIELRSHMKATLTAHTLWGKGIEARRKMADWISTYGKILQLFFFFCSYEAVGRGRLSCRSNRL
jgi:hypothetical protein